MKRWLSVILACLLMVALLAACGSSNAGGNTTATQGTGTAATTAAGTKATNEAPFSITMMYLVGAEGEDFPKIQQAISDAAKRDINMTVKLVPVSFGTWQQQQQLMLSSGEPLDVFTMFGSQANTYINNGYLVNMAPLIDEYGKGIVKQLGEDIAKAARIGDFQYLVPGYKEYVYPGGINMRTDIMKECNIDPAGIKTFQDLTNVFKTVKEKHPTMDMVVSDFVDSVALTYCDGLTDNFGVLLNDDTNSSKVVNWFESDKYKELAHLARDWYKAGYMKKDLATSTETSESLIKAGNAFSFFCPQKPNTQQEKASQTGLDITSVEIGPRFTNTSAIAGIGYSIAANTKDEKKAMTFLNWTYTSADFMNLIDWGIEGEHYVVTDKANGIIDFPQGITAQNAKYHIDLGWALPNQSIAYKWKGNSPDVWKKYGEFNSSAKKSLALGFAYKPEKVVDEIAACSAVYQKYYKTIGCGTVDPDEYIAKFSDEMKKAGIQKIIDEKQAQLDEWLKTKK